MTRKLVWLGTTSALALITTVTAVRTTWSRVIQALSRTPSHTWINAGMLAIALVAVGSDLYVFQWSEVQERPSLMATVMRGRGANNSDGPYWNVLIANTGNRPILLVDILYSVRERDGPGSTFPGKSRVDGRSVERSQLLEPGDVHSTTVSFGESIRLFKKYWADGRKIEGWITILAADHRARHHSIDFMIAYHRFEQVALFTDPIVPNPFSFYVVPNPVEPILGGGSAYFVELESVVVNVVFEGEDGLSHVRSVTPLGQTAPDSVLR